MVWKARKMEEIKREDTIWNWAKIEGSHLLICLWRKLPLVRKPWRHSIFISLCLSNIMPLESNTRLPLFSWEFMDEPPTTLLQSHFWLLFRIPNYHGFWPFGELVWSVSTCILFWLLSARHGLLLGGVGGWIFVLK